MTIPRSEHICGIYERAPAEQFSVVLPFIRDGIASGERCIYVVDDQSTGELYDALSSAGIDAVGAIASSKLVVWTRKEWRPDGPLVSAEKAEQLRQTIASALEDGFCGVRFVIEMTWTLDPAIDADALAHWEATIDTVITPETPARMYCNYSRSRLAPEVIRAALATHQHALIGEQSMPNPYYESPLILDGMGSPLNGHEPDRRAEWMIQRLRSSQADTEQPAPALTNIKEDFVSLVSHEVRNPLTTVVGLSRFLEEHWSGLEHEVIADTLRLLSRDAARLSEFIDNILVLSGNAHEPWQPELVSVSAVTNRVIERFRRRQPTRSLICELASGLPVVQGHEGRIAQVLWNLISNADRYSEPDTPITVVVERNADDSGGVTVRVIDEGRGLPPTMESAGSEPPLAVPGAATNGGVGLGLAVCRRLATAMGGSVTLASRTDAHGAIATFVIPESVPARRS